MTDNTEGGPPAKINDFVPAVVDVIRSPSFKSVVSSIVDSVFKQRDITTTKANPKEPHPNTQRGLFTSLLGSFVGSVLAQHGLNGQDLVANDPAVQQ
ncbi:hypothetical protein H0H81_010962, partial [Sphagnurus paluster]